MNAVPRSENERLDRLVDGELTAEEYRDCLAALDEQPEGWRRCALAFLEAQALRRDLPVMKQPAPQPLTAVEMAPQSRDWSHTTWQTLYFASLAASLALAFFLGGWTNPARGPAGGQIASGEAEPRSKSAEDDRKQSQLASAQQAEMPPATADGSSPIGNVRLVVDGAQQQGVDVPVYDEKQMSGDWQSASPPALSPQLIEQLERAGHKVNRQQRVVRVQLKDGRQLLLPVENYQIEPVEEPAY